MADVLSLSAFRRAKATPPVPLSPTPADVHMTAAILLDDYVKRVHATGSEAEAHFAAMADAIEDAVDHARTLPELVEALDQLVGGARLAAGMAERRDAR